MKITIKKHMAKKMVSRLKKKARIRRRVQGSTARPRLCVYRSTSHIYAQVIDDSRGVTLVAASSLDVEGVKGANKETAKKIGAEVAKRALAKNIGTVVFDRNGYLFHGRIQALADAAREAGLKF